MSAIVSSEELTLEQRLDLLRVALDWPNEERVVFADAARIDAYRLLARAINAMGPWPKLSYKGMCWTCFAEVNDGMPHADDCSGVAIRDALALLFREREGGA